MLETAKPIPAGERASLGKFVTNCDRSSRRVVQLVRLIECPRWQAGWAKAGSRQSNSSKRTSVESRPIDWSAAYEGQQITSAGISSRARCR